MNTRCLVRLYCNIVSSSQSSKSSLPLTLANLKKRSSIVYPSVSSYEEFSPDFQSSSKSEESTCESESVLPKTLSKKELYAHADEVTTAKKCGCAPTKRALTLVRGVLHARSHLKTSLSDRSVTLFNFHSVDFAEKLVQQNGESRKAQYQTIVSGPQCELSLVLQWVHKNSCANTTVHQQHLQPTVPVSQVFFGASSNIGSLVIVESDRSYARLAKVSFSLTCCFCYSWLKIARISFYAMCTSKYMKTTILFVSGATTSFAQILKPFSP
ncbi:hypothetical protein Y032_0190g1249 [Ancylostoma ceylanicum]|uniref:Uncharacterized protein n=1 Tax=Ancylostoma ceylanicum TaxID=53326 RepID=A0A016SR08_9BILA|nr:hypothetical protein Y032_0190g1249 [Ancylostoma ceylanicum]